jgi:hypothetical protein
MTITPDNQMTESHALYRGEDCGLAVVESIVMDDGQPHIDMGVLEQAEAAWGDSPADGTSGPVNVWALGQHGIPATIWSMDSRAAINAALAAGKNRVALAIRSTYGGQPQVGGPAGHWVLTDGTTVMNPANGGLYGPPYLDQCIAAQQRYGYTVDRAVGGGAGTPPTQVGGGPLNASQAQCIAEIASRLLLGREWGSAGISQMAGAILSGDAEAVVQWMEAQPEAVDWQARLYNVVNTARNLGDGAVNTAFQFGHDWVDQPDGTKGWGTNLGSLFARVAALEGSVGKLQAIPPGSVDPASLAPTITQAIATALRAGATAITGVTP